MDKMKEYMKALQEGKGYGWIDQNGFDMNKGDLIGILKEFTYVVSNSMEKDYIYSEVIDGLNEYYIEEE